MLSRVPQAVLPTALVAALVVVVSGRDAVTALVLSATAFLLLAVGSAALAARRPTGWFGWSIALIGSAIAIAGLAWQQLATTSVADVSINGGPLALRSVGGVVALGGLFVVAAAKRAKRDGHGAIDAMIGAVAVVSLFWQFAYGLDGTTVSFSVSSALLIPLAGGLRVVAIARLVFATTRPEQASKLLVPGATAVAIGELLSGLQLADSNPFAGDVPVALMVIGWLLFSAGVAHVDLAVLSEPTLRPRAAISPRRLATLAGAQVLVLVALAGNALLDRPVDATGVAICAALSGLLVLGRVVVLVAAVERARNATRQRDRWYRQLVRHSADVLFVLDERNTLQFASPAIEHSLGIPSGEALGKPITEFLADESIEAFRATIDGLHDQPGKVGASLVVQLRHATGPSPYVELNLSDRRDDPAVQGIVVNARDVTDRRRQAEEINFAYEKQAAIAALGRAALGGSGLADLAREAVRQISETLRVDAVELYKVPAGERALYLEAATGPMEAVVGELSIAAGPTSQAGFAMVAGSSSIVSKDLRRERRFDTTPHLEAGMASAVTVVVQGTNTIYGHMTVSSRVVDAFGDRDISFLTLMANELALALERRTAEEETRHQALHDGLTGLPNRVMFLDRLTTVAQRANGGSDLLGVLFLDLDHFKVVNDSLGHDAGDELLVEVAQRLQKAVRPTDIVARFGGDEFVVLCEHLDSIESAEAIARRVRENMDPPFILGGNEVHVSASAGIAVTERVGSDPEGMLRDADAAMYKAKERGRARYEVFDLTMRDAAIDRLQTESALHKALAEEELVLHYQPIVLVPGGEPAGVEALVRWNHPDLGLVGPEKFIPIAEKTGLIDDVGFYVLARACRALTSWKHDFTHAEQFVSVNLSANQLAQSDLVQRVSEMITATGADPTRLMFEITETAVMADVTKSGPVLEALRQTGVRIAVDDFGTGQSSLAYLRKLPVDILKIDKEFVRGVGTSSEDGVIANAVINLAHLLGLRAIAEGVEDNRQFDELAAMGCDLIQGYLFSEPVPFESVRWDRSRART